MKYFFIEYSLVCPEIKLREFPSAFIRAEKIYVAQLDVADTADINKD